MCIYIYTHLSEVADSSRMDLCSGFGFLLALNLDAQLLKRTCSHSPETQTISKVPSCGSPFLAPAGCSCSSPGRIRLKSAGLFGLMG